MMNRKKKKKKKKMLLSLLFAPFAAFGLALGLEMRSAEEWWRGRREPQACVPDVAAFEGDAEVLPELFAVGGGSSWQARGFARGWSTSRVTARSSACSWDGVCCNEDGRVIALSMQRWGVTALPESFGSLDALSELSLSYNSLSSLPESFGNLTGLASLMLNSNAGLGFPGPVARLEGLEVLWLDSNGIAALPASLGHHPKLAVLTLTSNPLVPETLGAVFELTSLEFLALASCGLTSIPGGLGALVNLNSLSLNSNALTSIPDSIGQLAALMYLYIDENLITTLPAAFTDLRELTWVGLTYNRLESLPEDLGRLEHLVCLWATGNRIRSVPESIGSLPLRKLALDANSLSSLPKSMAGLDLLEELDLSSNFLTSLPPVIPLAVLGLANNSIAAPVPCSETLTSLVIQKNAFYDGGGGESKNSSSGCLPNLASFLAGGNSLSSLSFLAGASALRDLDISDNPGPFSDAFASFHKPRYDPFFAVRSLRAASAGIRGPLSLVIEAISGQFPNVVDLDLSGNAGIEGALDNVASASFYTFKELLALNLDGVNVTGVSKWPTVSMPFLTLFSNRRAAEIEGGPYAFPLAWPNLRSADLRGAGNLTDALTGGSVVPVGPQVIDPARGARCYNTFTVGKTSAFSLTRNPVQAAYGYCECLEGFFGRPESGPCAACPPTGGPICAGGVLTAQASWPVLLDSGLVVVVPCPSDRASENPCKSFRAGVQPGPGAGATRESRLRYIETALAGSRATLCGGGYEDRLCARCSRGHHRSGRSCEPCGSLFWVIPVVSTLFQAALAIKVLGQGDAVRSGLFRTLMLHFQLFAALPRSLNVAFPSAIGAVYKGSERGTSLQLEGFECSETGWDGFFAPFGLACALPALLAVAALVLALLSRLRKREDLPPISIRSRFVLGAAYLWSVLVFEAARRILSALNCTAYGDSAGRRFVATALWVECRHDSGPYAAVFGAAIVLGPVFLVVTLAVVAVPLRWPGPATRPLKSFFEAPYRQGLLWWELVQTARRLLLAALQALLPYQSVSLPVATAVLLAGSLAGHAWLKPFRLPGDNFAEGVSLFLLVVTYMGGLAVASAAYTGAAVVSWILVVANISFLFALAAGLAKRYARKLTEAEKDKAQPLIPLGT
jgi:Leucine-rich repeat (LRR) protein